MSVKQPTGFGSISIHPLVILSITDHYTRRRSLETPKDQRVVGIILGTADATKAELITSFEARLNDPLQLNDEEILSAVERVTQMNSLVEVVGWYTAGGPNLSEENLQISAAVSRLFKTDRLLTVLLDTSELAAGLHTDDGLPIHIYEQSNHRQKVLYHVESTGGERIGVDAATTVDQQDANQALKLSTASHTIATATTQLSKRLDVITEYLRRVQSGAIPVDREILRSLDTLCMQLPKHKKEDGTVSKAAEEDPEYIRAVLTVYLGITAHSNGVTKQIIADGLKKSAHGL